MRPPKILALIGCTAWMCASAAADPATNEKTTSPSIPELVRNLADPKFRVREDASRSLWQLGNHALSALKEATRSEDPEMAHRARELVRKIELSLTPDTDPEVIAIVERYEKASAQAKTDLMMQLHQKRAWLQLLKLYAMETSPQIRSQMEGAASVAAVNAGRECLKNGDALGAREYLELAPATPDSLFTLAEFHRTHGTLQEEIKRAKSLKGVQGGAWRLALYKSAGDLKSARTAAVEAELSAQAVQMAMLDGDPLPWLRHPWPESRRGRRDADYMPLAIKRFSGQLTPQDIAKLETASGGRQQSERNSAIVALYLLGEYDEAEKAFLKHFHSGAFLYLTAGERIDEALESFGIDPAEPDFKSWVTERVPKEENDEAEDEFEEGASFDYEDLNALAAFLEGWGLHEEALSAFSEPMVKMAGHNEGYLLDFLSALLGDSRSGAPRLGVELADQWAGHDDDRWNRIIVSLMSDDGNGLALWDWMSELEPSLGPKEKLTAYLALCRSIDDPESTGDWWMERIWQAIDAAEAGERSALLAHVRFLVQHTDDAEDALAVWDRLEEIERKSTTGLEMLDYLTAVDRWQDAVDILNRVVTNNGQNQIYVRLDLHAMLAACLRKTGNDKEAAKHDDIVEKLSLGRDTLTIAKAYESCGDFERHDIWVKRAAIGVNPNLDSYLHNLSEYGRILLEKEKWRESAALWEVVASSLTSRDIYDSSDSARTLMFFRQVRFQADLSRAMSNLGADRKASVEMLDSLHSRNAFDGGLADYFFPAVRAAGLIREHDKWFEASWQRVEAVTKRYPGSHNTANTAGWLASRACRRLAEAEVLLKGALEKKPRQPAYLDTMAEIQFAKKSRAKALEWSMKAVKASPSTRDRTSGLPLDAMIRRQHERFRVGEFPR